MPSRGARVSSFCGRLTFLLIGMAAHPVCIDCERSAPVEFPVSANCSSCLEPLLSLFAGTPVTIAIIFTPRTGAFITIIIIILLLLFLHYWLAYVQ